MREILIALSLKYEGDWQKIYKALDQREKVDVEVIKQIQADETLKAITIVDKQYPRKLKNIAQPPFVLFYKGNIELLDMCKAVAVVGTRKPTSTYLTITEKIVGGLNDKYTIVSGLALGIDGKAHESALKSNKNTIAVLGCGIDQVYPIENKDLFLALEEKGLIVSEYPNGIKPEGDNFLSRNRIVSALSDGVLVVQANSKSGTMNTVRHAMEQGRDVMCVPGPVDCGSGTNELLKQGAYLVENAKDIEQLI